jgi:hypothetical protein
MFLSIKQIPTAVEYYLKSEMQFYSFQLSLLMSRNEEK